MSKDLQYYLDLPYTRVLRRDEEGDFVAKIEELPGCISHGKTEEEALKNIREVMTSWIEECLSAGQPIPEPVEEEVLPSGKWLQRVPRSVHRKLSLVAKVEGVSLNQLVSNILSEALGMRTRARESESSHWGPIETGLVSWVIDLDSRPANLVFLESLTAGVKRSATVKLGKFEDELEPHVHASRK